MISESRWVLPGIERLPATVFIFGLLPGLAAASLEPPPLPLFEGNAVEELRLTFHQPDWWKSLPNNFEGQEDPPYMVAEFDWQATHFDPICVRLKGSGGYYVNSTISSVHIAFDVPSGGDRVRAGAYDWGAGGL